MEFQSMSSFSTVFLNLASELPLCSTRFCKRDPNIKEVAQKGNAKGNS